MSCSNTIVMVGNTVVCNDYLQQQGLKVLAEIDAKFDLYLKYKREIQAEYELVTSRVDIKHRLLYN